MAEDALTLTVLTGDELAADRFPDLPVRLLVHAAFAEEGREDRPARVEVRMRPDRLTDLAQQMRAAQAALDASAHRRANCRSEAIQEERERATHVALHSSSPPADIDLLKRVLVCLGGEIPAAAMGP